MAACHDSRAEFALIPKHLYGLHIQYEEQLHHQCGATQPQATLLSGLFPLLCGIGSGGWCLCFALYDIAGQLLDLVDTINTIPRRTGLALTCHCNL